MTTYAVMSATCHRTRRPPSTKNASGRALQRHSRAHASRLVRCRIYDARRERSRFLQADPIEGGSCNDYDYTCADPINATDLTGMYKVNDAERRLCIRRPKECAIVNNARRATERIVKQLYGREPADGSGGNAVKHVIWAALITMKIRGPQASVWLNAHESDAQQSSGRKRHLSNLDLWNNDRGMWLGATLKNQGHADPWDDVTQWTVVYHAQAYLGVGHLRYEGCGCF